MCNYKDNESIYIYSDIVYLLHLLNSFATHFYVSSVVRELQQDARELNQGDVPEVDPEENSAEFMGILIKVHPWILLNTVYF